MRNEISTENCFCTKIFNFFLKWIKISLKRIVKNKSLVLSTFTQKVTYALGFEPKSQIYFLIMYIITSHATGSEQLGQSKLSIFQSEYSIYESSASALKETSHTKIIFV